MFYGCSIHLLLLGLIKLVNLVTKTNSVYCQRIIKKHIASSKWFWVGRLCLIGQVCEEQSNYLRKSE